jgi:hypothetical protein
MQVRDCRTFAVEPPVFDWLRKELETRGYSASDDEGTLEFRSVRGSYRYDRAAQTLELCVLERPAFMPVAIIWQTLDRLASHHLGRPPVAITDRAARAPEAEEPRTSPAAEGAEPATRGESSAASERDRGDEPVTDERKRTDGPVPSERKRVEDA